MRINFFYKDASAVGGAPDDFRDMFHSFAKERQGHIYSFSGAESTSNACNAIVQTEGVRKLAVIIFRNRKTLRCSHNILIGGMIWQNSAVALAFYFLKIKFDVLPFSQMAQYAVSNKIFVANPIIRGGSVARGNHSSMSKAATVIFKRAFFHTAGAFMLKKAQNVWVASDFEKAGLYKAFPKLKPKKWIYYSMGVNTVSQRSKDYNYSEYRSHTNLVFWGRVDYKHKGLDRLVAAVAGEPDFFRRACVLIHVLGPSYNGGKEVLISEAEKGGVRDLFVVPGDEHIKTIDLGGLTNADGMILITRWEGHPRVIRESLFFGVPALISPESHFGDRHFPSIVSLGGICVEAPDIPATTCGALISFVELLQEKRKRLSSESRDCGELSTNHAIDWTKISQDILAQLE